MTNKENIKSRYDYNKYIFSYETLFEENDLEIIMETSFYQPVSNFNKVKIHSFIGDFCVTNKITLPIKFESSIFEMNVQTIQRTFVDKVFAICDYYLQDMRDRDSRHIYDLYKLLPFINFNNELFVLFKEVRLDRMKTKNNPSSNPNNDIIKILNDIIETNFYESDYKNVTQKLLYEDLDYNVVINKGLKVIVNNINNPVLSKLEN